MPFPLATFEYERESKNMDRYYVRKNLAPQRTLAAFLCLVCCPAVVLKIVRSQQLRH